jgi:multidrug efflux system membrane fusion protein
LSNEEVERRIAARETAAAMVMQAEAAVEAAQLQLGYTQIRSPIAGQISRTLVTRGNLVGQNEDTVLTTIVSMDPLYVYFDVPERDLVEYQRSLGEGQETELLSQALPVEIAVATEAGYPHTGRLDFRENRVDPSTGTVRMRGRIPNPRVPPGNVRLLYPGLFARVRLPRGVPRSLPAIPEDALMTGQEGRFVYVLGEGNVIEKRTVTVGPVLWRTSPASAPAEPSWKLVAAAAQQPTLAGQTADQKAPAVYSIVAIEGGLTTEDQVVIMGVTKARPGAPVVPQSWELQHAALTVAANQPVTQGRAVGNSE